MPVFEYYCPDNHTVYQFFARKLGMDNKIPRCPDNPHFRMQKMMSAFSITGLDDIEEMDKDLLGNEDPKIQEALEELESGMATLDRNKPEEISQLMERVSQVSGEKLPKNMQEILRRINSGEDLQKLEHEYSESLETEANEGISLEKKIFKRLLRQKIKKDQKLYELSEYAAGE